MRGKWVHDVLRDRLLSRKGLLEPLPQITLKELEEEVKATSWDSRFLQFMFNRLLMGRLRYGPKKKGAAVYKYVKSIAEKVKQYEETGNTENLVDIANYAMLEFRHGIHPNKHFSATDDQDHCEKGTTTI